MALLNNEILQNVKEMLANITHEVKLIVFTSSQNCDYCKEIAQLTQEVAAAADKVSVEIKDIARAPEQARALNIKRAPAIAMVGAKDYGIRYYGIPSGHEFSTLLYGIQKAGNGKSELDHATRTYLDGIHNPVNLKVFVTPTCPYCPRAAILAYDMAVASDKVDAEVIESMEFQDLSMQFNVMGVPLSVINDTERVEGAAPANMLVSAIEKATTA